MSVSAYAYLGKEEYRKIKPTLAAKHIETKVVAESDNYFKIDVEDIEAFIPCLEEQGVRNNALPHLSTELFKNV